MGLLWRGYLQIGRCVHTLCMLCMQVHLRSCLHCRELEAAKAAQREAQHAKQGSAAGAAGHTVACPRQPSDAIVGEALAVHCSGGRA